MLVRIDRVLAMWAPDWLWYPWVTSREQGLLSRPQHGKVNLR